MIQSMKILLAIALLAPSVQASATEAWSTQDYDLYPGDFDGDGNTDMLYVAKDPGFLSGIVLSDGTGLNVSLQSWGNAWLGIPWSAGLYQIVVADFNGDGKADILLQRNTAGDHYLLLMEEGGIGGISQTIPNDAAGLDWSLGQHRLVAGDFNGDGKADLFLQSAQATGLNAVVLADDNGQFTASQPYQSWDDGYAGFDWAASEANVYAGDFNGDGLDDLLLQARPVNTGANQPVELAPNMNGVVLAQAAAQIFIAEGVQAWNGNGFSAEWSPLENVVVVGDFNGDQRADVILQGITADHPGYALHGRATGAIFTTAVQLDSNTMPGADSARLIAGRFLHAQGDTQGDSLYFQAQSAQQFNFFARVSDAAVIVAQQDAAFAVGSSQITLAAGMQELTSSATVEGQMAAALATPTSAGRTPGQFAVSPTGLATYQIPIWTPTGARGIQPKLALVYSSGSPDGVLGPGWSLSGLSAISRCNKTYADNNGDPAAVTLTTSDDFCLNGNRLRLTNGTYGAAGSVYQTAIAEFSRITANGTAGNGPSNFLVEGKDGLRYEYGNTADSKAYTSTGSTPYAWMLNKVRDRQGNNLKITYSTTSGDIQPSSIQYTQTPAMSTSYPYTVSFTYRRG